MLRERRKKGIAFSFCLIVLLVSPVAVPTALADPEADYHTARELVKGKKYDQALALCDKVIKELTWEDEFYFRAFYTKGKIYEIQKKYNISMTLWQGLIDQYSGKVRPIIDGRPFGFILEGQARAKLAQCFKKMGDFEKVIAELEKLNQLCDNVPSERMPTSVEDPAAWIQKNKASNQKAIEEAKKSLAVIDIVPPIISVSDNVDAAIVCYIELSNGLNVADVDVSSIRLEGTVPVGTSSTEIGDYDHDNIADLTVRFSRTSVVEIVELGDQVRLLVTGALSNGKRFGGADTVILETTRGGC